MSRADYGWTIVQVFQDTRAIGVLEIVDMKGRVSVTNDIENVLIEIGGRLERDGLGQLEDLAVIYRDSMNAWDEVVLDHVGNFRRFAALPRGRCHTELRAEAVVRYLGRQLEERVT